MSWIRVKKGLKGGRMEGEAGGWEWWSEFIAGEVSMVAGAADRGRYEVGLSGGSLLRGGEGRNNGGILDGECWDGWGRGRENNVS